MLLFVWVWLLLFAQQYLSMGMAYVVVYTALVWVWLLLFAQHLISVGMAVGS